MCRCLWVSWNQYTVKLRALWVTATGKDKIKIFPRATLAKFINEWHGIQGRISGDWRNNGLGTEVLPRKPFRLKLFTIKSIKRDMSAPTWKSRKESNIKYPIILEILSITLYLLSIITFLFHYWIFWLCMCAHTCVYCSGWSGSPSFWFWGLWNRTSHSDITQRSWSLNSKQTRHGAIVLFCWVRGRKAIISDCPWCLSFTHHGKDIEIYNTVYLKILSN